MYEKFRQILKNLDKENNFASKRIVLNLFILYSDIHPSLLSAVSLFGQCKQNLKKSRNKIDTTMVINKTGSLGDVNLILLPGVK